jgi:hypothetical protein
VQILLFIGACYPHTDAPNHGGGTGGIGHYTVGAAAAAAAAAAASPARPQHSILRLLRPLCRHARTSLRRLCSLLRSQASSRSWARTRTSLSSRARSTT